MSKKIAVIFPTVTESRYFYRPQVSVHIGGVGLSASATSTVRILRDVRPDVLILAGIAGVYPGSKLRIGDTVLVAAEREADLGFFYEDGFRHLSHMQLDMEFPVQEFLECPYVTEKAPLPWARSNTMNAAMAPFVRTDDVDIENMEGSAFFYACLAEGVEFYQVRSISNEVDPAHKDWDYVSSIRNMTQGLNLLIDWLQDENNA